MLSESNFSLACRRIREHMANIVPAIMQRKPQPIPTIVLITVDLRHTLSFVGSLGPVKQTRLNEKNKDREKRKQKQMY